MKTEEQNKALVREACEQIWNLRNVAKIPDFYSHEYVADYPEIRPPVQGHDGLREWLEGIWSANPNYHEDLRELVAEGDLVVARLTISGIRKSLWGELPPDNRVKFEEIVIMKIRQGKIVGQHGVINFLPLLRQLGTIPARS
jgi:predicted ester cyclase